MTFTDMIPFGPWRPDLGSYRNDGNLVMAKNVLIQGTDYVPFKTLTEQTGALPSDVIGAARFQTPRGLQYIFAGTKTNLYLLTGSNTWSDVSGTTYNSSATDWRFDLYDEVVLATNFENVIQRYDTTVGGLFGNLAGSPPRCRDIAVSNSFLLAFNLVDGGTDRYTRLRWSAQGIITDWTTSGLGAGFNDVREDVGGTGQRVMALNDYAVLFFTDSIYRVEYIAQPASFGLRPLPRGRGTLAPNSLVRDGSVIYYYGTDGFYAFDGTNSVPIGENKIDRYFYDLVDFGKLRSIQGTRDPVTKNILWSFVSINSPNGYPDMMMSYNTSLQEWTVIHYPVRFLLSSYTTAQTLETLETLYGSIDNIPGSLDDPIYAGGLRVFGGFSPNNKYGVFSGASLEGELHTEDFRLNKGGRAHLSGLHVVTDATVMVATKHRNLQTEMPTQTSFGAINAITENVNFDVIARYTQFVIKLSGTWTRAKGFMVEFRPTGNE